MARGPVNTDPVSDPAGTGHRGDGRAPLPST